jgi:hypothetical protein
MFQYEVTNEKSMPVFFPPILWCNPYKDLLKLDYIKKLKKIHASLFFTILKKKFTFNIHQKKRVHATLDRIESNRECGFTYEVMPFKCIYLKSQIRCIYEER